MDQMAAENGVGIFVAPNFALGAVVLMHLAKQAAPYFEYAEIIEAHHEAKIDSPSGTALTIARMIAGDKQFLHNDPKKETLDGTRGGNHNGSQRPQHEDGRTERPPRGRVRHSRTDRIPPPRRAGTGLLHARGNAGRP